MLNIHVQGEYSTCGVVEVAKESADEARGKLPP